MITAKVFPNVIITNAAIVIEGCPYFSSVFVSVLTASIFHYFCPSAAGTNFPLRPEFKEMSQGFTIIFYDLHQEPIYLYFSSDKQQLSRKKKLLLFPS